ncbi:hypothetical protein H4R34_000539 [Dimargaris verticillata]|uniref:ribonuclease T2 n=1 Tax=Dimargaris verticillata TaxID=2761393 RepID=A0A9W8BD41_9FUNG|nr:hypothetical protein H4R34_000539 [Dimargaris verticillata]
MWGPNAAPRFNSMFNCHTMQTQLRETDVFQTPGDQKLQTALNSRWLTVSMTTNYQLWNHEFIKHGTCVSHINYQRCTPTHWSLLDRQRIETLSYFNMVNVFSHQVNVKALFQASGIAPIYTKPYSRTSILQALAAQTQVAVELQCWTNTNTNSQGASTQTSTYVQRSAVAVIDASIGATRVVPHYTLVALAGRGRQQHHLIPKVID